jgi:hypothetical protein
MYTKNISKKKKALNKDIFLFRNFPWICSFPQSKDIILSLGLLAFICFCDGWGAGPPHQPPTWGTRIFCQGYLPYPLVSPHHSCKATRSVTLDRGPYRVLSAGASRTLVSFSRLLLLPLLLSQQGLRPAMAELTRTLTDLLSILSNFSFLSLLHFSFRAFRIHLTVKRLFTIDNIHYIPVSTTLFPAGGICCLRRHVSARVCHLQVRFLVTIILSNT